jgi:HSP20 family protein
MSMLVRWTPFNEMARLQSNLNRLFDSFDARPANGNATSETVEQLWTPAVDIVEDADKIELHVDLPGVKQEAVDIQIDKDVLTLRGSRTVERKESKDHFRRYERVNGGFVRSFSLPKTVDAEKIAAALKDGVLTLTLPKRPEAQPRQIKVAIQ